MRARHVALALIMTAAACEEEAPSPALHALDPAQAYSDQITRLKLRGEQFVPVVVLDLEQNLRVPLNDGFKVTLRSTTNVIHVERVTWQSPQALEVELPAAALAPAAIYDVEVIDPRGKRALLAGAFTSLGPDTQPPTLTLLEPTADRPVAPGVAMPVKFAGQDPAPGMLAELRYKIVWRQQVLADGPCALAYGGAATTCAFEARVPDEAVAGDAFAITLTAIDRSLTRHTTTRVLSFVLQPRPRLMDIKPQVGTTAGGTDVVVRGANFLRGSQVLIGGRPLVPDGGRFVDDNTIAGRAPPGPQGFAVVEIIGLTGQDKLIRPNGFTYLPAHEITDVTPSRVSAAGQTRVSIRGVNLNDETRIVFGDQPSSGMPLLEQEHVSPGEIRGVAPTGVGSTFVWAVDPLLGKTRWPGVFSWVPAAAEPKP